MIPERVVRLQSAEAPGELTRGQRIRRLRELYYSSQTEASKACGLSQGYLSQLEADEWPLGGYQKTIRFLKAFGQGLGFLEGEVDSRVFLTPLASTLKALHDSLVDHKRAILLKFIASVIPPLEDPGLKYIEQVPSEKTPGEKIRELRERIGYTQGQLASESQVSQGYLSQVETGYVKEPSIEKLKNMAGAVNTNIYELLDFEEIEIAEEIARTDWFLRSEEIPLDIKRKVRQEIDAMAKLLIDPDYARVRELLFKMAIANLLRH